MIQIAIPGRQGGRTTRDRTRGRWRKAWSGRPARRRHWSFNDNEHHAMHLRPASPAASATAPGLCSDWCRREQSRHGCRDRGPRLHSDLSPVTRRVLGYHRLTHHERRLPAAPDVGGLCERGGRCSARRKKTSARARASPSWPSRRVESSSGFRLRHVGGRAGGTGRVSPRRDPSARAITNPSCPMA